MPACNICEEVITQPICVTCLQDQIASWLSERMPERPELLLRLEELTEEIQMAGGATHCIKCNSQMSTCSYCYTEHLMTWVAKIAPNLVGEFHTYFGFLPFPGAEQVVPLSKAVII